MNGILFASEKDPIRKHSLITFLNLDADLVFDDRESCLTDGAHSEVNDCLTIHAQCKDYIGIVRADFCGNQKHLRRGSGCTSALHAGAHGAQRSLEVAGRN
jgi:hypothetical protein